MDEDTDLLDPVYQNGGQVNPQWRPSRNGLKGSQRGKPEPSSKDLDENITTEKKTDSSGRSSSFPGKPDDIIDLDTGNIPKKPSVGFPVLPKIPLGPRTPTVSSQLREETDDQSRNVSPTSHIITSTSLAKELPEDGGTISTQSTTHPDKKPPGTVIVVSRDGDLVQGSDSKTYRLHRGPPGQMGPPGQEVSSNLVLLLLSRGFEAWSLRTSALLVFLL